MSKLEVRLGLSNIPPLKPQRGQKRSWSMIINPFMFSERSTNMAQQSVTIDHERGAKKTPPLLDRALLLDKTEPLS